MSRLSEVLDVRFDEGLVPPMPESFGRRLRAVRERQQVSIAAIAESTKILGALLEGLENDDVSRWPTGLYRRAFIRAYATAIGLDPEPVVREFIARFPDHVAAAPSAVPVSTPAPRAVLRLTLAEPVGLPGATIGQSIARRVIAAAADLMVLAVLGASVYAVLGDFWLPLTVVVIAYYVGGVLLLGNTPGVCLAAATARGLKVRNPFRRVKSANGPASLSPGRKPGSANTATGEAEPNRNARTSEAEPRQRLPRSRTSSAAAGSGPPLRLGFRSWSDRAFAGWQEWLSRH